MNALIGLGITTQAMRDHGETWTWSNEQKIGNYSSFVL